VTGWVRNVGADDRVEALLQGEKEKVDQIIELIKKGPPVSRVAAVEIFWQEPREVFDEFKIVK
jgi:acylphosphatase